MKNQILNLGKSLNKAEQQQINGGANLPYDNERDCELNGGIWYACISECYNSKDPHFPPCM